jgi:hypothetical protein
MGTHASRKDRTMKKANAEILLNEIALWRQEQRIDAATAERLAQRYQQQGSLLAVFLRWLGLGSVLLLAGALFSMIGLSMHSKFVSAFLVAAAAIALLYLGVRMTRDPSSPYPVTGAALTTLGLVAVFGAVVLFAAGDTFDERMLIQSGLLFTALASLGIAYRYALRWPLLLGLLAIFHGLGSGSAYAGSGEYVADIADPPLMAVVAFVVAAFGVWHLRAEDGRLARYAGFGRLYLILGLLYGNTSLWFLSLARFSDYRILWTVLFAIACVTEIVLGARLKDGRFSGFGIVFLSICLYTCFFETAWDKLGSGLFLFLGGLLGLLLGLAFEWWGRREHSTAQAVTP